MVSPLDVLGFYVVVYKFFGWFPIESDNKIKLILTKTHTILSQVLFTHLGFVLFTLAILQSSSTKETLQILFVVFAYVNAAFKALSFYAKREELRNLWLKLDDTDFVAKNACEIR